MSGLDEHDFNHWEHFRYFNGTGVRGFGVDLNKAFEEAAKALTALMLEPEMVQPLEKLEVSCEGDSADQLCQNWLDLLINTMMSHNMLFSHFEVEISGSKLKAEIWGESLCDSAHQPTSFPSHALEARCWVGQRPDGQWCAQCAVAV